jgi:hypothetical protein
MHIKALLLLPALAASVLAIGPQCCCDRYSEFSLDNDAAIVSHCKQLWTDISSGKQSGDYCSGVYCLQQQDTLHVLNALKCADAALQCGRFSRVTLALRYF